MEFLGMMFIFIIGGGSVYLVRSTAEDPSFVAALGTLSPWAASHSVMLGSVAAALVVLITILIPVVLITRDSHSGDSQLEVVGRFGSSVLVSYGIVFFVVLAIPAISYLLGLGWFAAQHAVGH